MTNNYDYPADPINMLDLTGMCSSSSPWLCYAIQGKAAAERAATIASALKKDTARYNRTATAEDERAAERNKWVPPLTNVKVTSGGQWNAKRDTGSGAFYTHNGVDLAGGRGDTAFAAHRGTIVFSGNGRDYGPGFGIYGQMVIIDTGDVSLLYGHLNSRLVESGTVAAGDAIGTVGNSGCGGCGTHLHYGAILGGQFVNPNSYLVYP